MTQEEQTWINDGQRFFFLHKIVSKKIQYEGNARRAEANKRNS